MWRFARALCGSVIALASLTEAVGQTTVQQPVFQSFSTGTTVTVPDGGSALLGGVSSARYGSSWRGTPMVGKLPGVGRLFNNGAFGSDLTSSQNFVRATIIDLNEMDQAVLNQARAGRFSSKPTVGFQRLAIDPAAAAVQHQARDMTRNVGRRQPTTANHVRRSQEIAPPSDARRLLALGDRALADGKLELAARYFREAERTAALALKHAPAISRRD